MPFVELKAISEATFQQPSLPDNIAWHAFMTKLQAAAPHFAVDPVSGETDYVDATPSNWVCACGATLPS